jgi:hypothetical protein
MPTSVSYRALSTIALTEFSDVVVSARIVPSPVGEPRKLRLDIADGSLLDAFASVGGRYSYHWDRRATPASDVYRHDNAPHERWRHVATFPKHFHDGSEDRAIESLLSDDPEQALREFLIFVRDKLLTRA